MTVWVPSAQTLHQETENDATSGSSKRWLLLCGIKLLQSSEHQPKTCRNQQTFKIQINWAHLFLGGYIFAVKSQHSDFKCNVMKKCGNTLTVVLWWQPNSSLDSTSLLSRVPSKKSHEDIKITGCQSESICVPPRTCLFKQREPRLTILEAFYL